jgi:predicted glycoside hydrolase/deacetylase ChbG (UPF0249 family)
VAITALLPVFREHRGGIRAHDSLRRLIIHGDDFGLSPSVNGATIAALEQGTLSSASVMVPCPSFADAATYATQHPDLDIGIHLTLTSEWPDYRWGPIAPKQEVPSLVDKEGYFWSDSGTVARRANLAEVNIELVHQIERALAAGMRPTHLDSHMFTLFQTPGLYSIYVRVAHKFSLPYLSPGCQFRTAFGIVDDRTALRSVYIAYAAMSPENWLSAHVQTVDRLLGGINQILVHTGFFDDDLVSKIGDDTPWGAAWRQRDFDVINHPEFRLAIERNAIGIVGWREARLISGMLSR